jgi:hypothetical protein
MESSLSAKYNAQDMSDCVKLDEDYSSSRLDSKWEDPKE